MSYFMIQRLRGEKPGHPIFFSYTLDKTTGGENVQENPYKVYFTNYSNSPLVFLCKHTKIDFDFYDLSGGEYFVSAPFLQLAQSLDVPDVKSISAQLVSSKREVISKNDYAVIRIKDQLDAVDQKKSTIEPAATAPHILITKHLAIDPNIVGERDLFRLKDMTLGGNVFCSEKFKRLAEAHGIVANFIPEEIAAEEFARINPLGPK